MARYIKRAIVIGGSELWVGLDLEGVEGDFSEEGYLRAEEFTAEQLVRMGVTKWIVIPCEEA